eukprot:gene24066-biopygen11878
MRKSICPGRGLHATSSAPSACGRVRLLREGVAAGGCACCGRACLLREGALAAGGRACCGRACLLREGVLAWRRRAVTESGASPTDQESDPGREFYTA